MFEKDAEEYGEKDLGGKYLSSVVAKDKLHAYKLGQYDGFIAGAEFAYNKANEWHYVKDGDYPKECDCCLLYLGKSVNPITGLRHRGVWYFDDDRDLEEWQDKVIAWKEIVLPELKENE